MSSGQLSVDSRAVSVPVPEQDAEVGSRDDAFDVQVADRRVVEAPEGEQEPAVRRLDASVEIEVAAGEVAEVGESVAVAVLVDAVGDVAVVRDGVRVAVGGQPDGEFLGGGGIIGHEVEILHVHRDLGPAELGSRDLVRHQCGPDEVGGRGGGERERTRHCRGGHEQRVA